MKKKIASLISLVCLIPAFGFLVSCIANYGSLKSNPSLMQVYQEKALLSDYNYFYSGRANLPYAVIGLDKKFTFSTMGWFKIENMDDVYHKIKWLDDRHGFGVSPHVFPADIHDQQGNKIGIWFAYYTHTPIKVDYETNTAVVLNPYSPNDDRIGR